MIWVYVLILSEVEPAKVGINSYVWLYRILSKKIETASVLNEVVKIIMHAARPLIKG